MKPFNEINPLEMHELYKGQKGAKTISEFSLLYSTTWKLMYNKVREGNKIAIELANDAIALHSVK